MSTATLRLSAAELDVLCALLALDPPDVLGLDDRVGPRTDVRHGDRVALRDLPAERAVAAVPDLLEPLRPASGRPVPLACSPRRSRQQGRTRTASSSSRCGGA